MHNSASTRALSGGLKAFPFLWFPSERRNIHVQPFGVNSFVDCAIIEPQHINNCKYWIEICTMVNAVPVSPEMYKTVCHYL